MDGCRELEAVWHPSRRFTCRVVPRCKTAIENSHCSEDELDSDDDVSSGSDDGQLASGGHRNSILHKHWSRLLSLLQYVFGFLHKQGSRLLSLLQHVFVIAFIVGTVLTTHPTTRVSNAVSCLESNSFRRNPCGIVAPGEIGIQAHPVADIRDFAAAGQEPPVPVDEAEQEASQVLIVPDIADSGGPDESTRNQPPVGNNSQTYGSRVLVHVAIDCSIAAMYSVCRILHSKTKL